jgi:hypothetical protein
MSSFRFTNACSVVESLLAADCALATRQRRNGDVDDRHTEADGRIENDAAPLAAHSCIASTRMQLTASVARDSGKLCDYMAEMHDVEIKKQ